MSNTSVFSRLQKIRAVGMRQAVMHKIPISRQLRTTSRTIRQPGERSNANDVTNDSTRTKRSRVTNHGRDWHSVTLHLRDRLMPAVVTAMNIPVLITIHELIRSVKQGYAWMVNANGQHARY